jgi:F-type H+-transporting ATPase subunit alpha
MAKGQRQVIIGDRSTGKTMLTVDSILQQKNKNIICVYCCIGKSYAALLKVLRTLHKHEALPYTIVVQALASAPCGQQYLAPYVASTLGEYFMYKGRDVLLLIDDLTRHSWSYREISLLMERPPGREAYPGDIYYIHAMLLERGGKLNKELGSGSMSSFSIVETVQGDITGFIPSNLVSMTDGQILLSTSLFTSGFKPAIDFGQSVSIIGSKAQSPALKELAQPLRLIFTKYNQLLALTKIKTVLSSEAETTLKRGGALSELFSQEKNVISPLAEQIILLYALNKGVLDDLDAGRIKHFKNNVLHKLAKAHPRLIPELSSGKLSLSESVKETLDKFLVDFLKAATEN